jgi:uncharacterized membrane protein (DUF441 family)
MDLIRSLLSSKKFIAAIIGIVIAIAGRYGFSLDPELVRELVYILIAYIVGQGIADHGKASAEIAVMGAISPTTAKEMIKDTEGKQP